MSPLDSYQCIGTLTTRQYCASGRERDAAVCMKAVTKKEWKRKKRYLIDVQFSTDKLATTEDRQTLQNSDEKQDCQYWIPRLVVFTRFPANRDCLLKLYIYVSEISLNSFSWASLGETCLYWAYFIWLTDGVATIPCFCAKLPSCCLTSPYSIVQGGPTTSDLRAILQKRDNVQATLNKMM